MDAYCAVSPDSNYASIDIGSHTIRLLIAGFRGNREILPLCIQRRITRLAANFQDGETLKAPGIEASIEALGEYAELLERFRVLSVACGATGVVRRARNSEELLDKVKELTGISASILSESSEAFLSAKGCLSVLPGRENRVLSFDLGGSSTEFLLADAQATEPLWSTSVFIGASTITERYLDQEPPAPSLVANAMEAVRASLAPALIQAKNLLDARPGTLIPYRLVGTAGTVTTLAAMLLEMEVYEPYRVNGLELTENWVSETINLLARLPLASRRSLPGLEEGREDIILGGALIVRAILEGLGQPRLTVTDGGLLEGLLLRHIEEGCGWAPALISPLTWRLLKG